MATRRVLIVVFGVVVCGLVLFLGWRRQSGPSTWEAGFQPGGTIDIDLSAGGYEIRGTTENQIRVELDSSEQRSAHSEIRVNGGRANVRLEGPSNNFSAVIFVPQQANLKVNQTIGQLRIVNVEGDKQIGLNIGQLIVDVPESEQLKRVEAAVTIGSVRANQWRTDKGGFFRSFQAGGQGKYSIQAHLDIGDIELR